MSKKIPLHDLHIEQGAHMVPFAGYSMPMQYRESIKREHLHTRSHVGLFDISHMGQFKLIGKQVALALESLVPGDIQGLSKYQQRYTVLTNTAGGIIDDVMVTNAGDYYLLVVNAACKDKDLQYLQANLGSSCVVEEITNHALLALQGPLAAAVMQRLCPQTDKLNFMTGGVFKLSGVSCFINRCGYTGEDGFELSVPAANAENIAGLLLEQEEVSPIGLGARDSLRLEAGLCLYGHELTAETTPVEAGLEWIISKSRLHEEDAQSFPGIQRIKEQINHGISRLRVGIQSRGKAPLRRDMNLLNEQNEIVGSITSGAITPSVGIPIAMAYIDYGYASIETRLKVNIRDRSYQVCVRKLPFVKHCYHKEAVH